jgi:hypothetical protein
MQKYKIEELKGTLIHNLKILDEGEYIIEGKKKRRTFICECKCGNVKSYHMLKLMKGCIKSCGKCKKENECFIGRKNGHLEIIEELSKKHTNRMFKVKCNNCNNTKIYATAIFNQKKHCGCLTVINQRPLKPLKLPMVKNIYTIVSETLDQDKRTRIVKAICNKCNTEHILNYYNINGKNKFGCYRCARKNALDEKRICGKEEYNKISIVYRNMKTRCTNENSKDYKNYGGRGITICSEWETKENFIKWAINNGYRKGLQIDREDNNGNYNPDNCRWVIKLVNGRNTRQTKLNEELVKEIRYGKYKDMTSAEISKIINVNASTIRNVIVQKSWVEI